MKMSRFAFGCLVALATLSMIAPTLFGQVQAQRAALTHGETALDENAVVLENDLLRAGIATNQYAGQILELVYKPTGDQLASPATEQGYMMDRMGEDRYFWRRKSDGYSGRIVEQSDELARAEVTYTWHYDYNDVTTDVRVTKRYTLRRGASVIEMTWKLTNVGDTAASMTPWIKHVGRRDGSLLKGPTRLAQKQGVIDARGFLQPARPWMTRLSGEETTTAKPMVSSVTNFTQTYQQFPWQGKHRFTLEPVLNNTRLKPGESWRTQHALLFTPNLGGVRYVAPELAVGLKRGDETLKAKQANEITLELAAAAPLGAVRVEGQITTRDGEAVAPLARRQIEVTPGQIERVTYAFTPPAAGVYDLNLTVYRGQQIVPLGKWTSAQDTGLVLPVVAGASDTKPKTKTETVFEPWESDGAGWKQRERKDVKPKRVLSRSDQLNVGQVMALKRVMPEHNYEFDDAVEPRLTFNAAKREWESGQFVVALPDDAAPGDVRVQVDALRNDQGGTLPTVELYEVKYLSTTTPSGYRSRYPIGQWPDPLWPHRKPVTLEPGAHQAFWVSAEVPADSTPGQYSAEVRVTLNGKTAARFDLALTVHPFTLPKRRQLRVNAGRVGWYSMKQNIKNLKAVGYEPPENAGKKLDNQFWAMATEYGISPRRPSLEKWKKYQDHGRGMTAFHIGYGGNNNLDEIEAWLKEKDLLHLSYVYAPFDEHTDAEVPDVVEWAKQFKAKSDVPIADVYYGDRVEPLFGLVDIWSGQDPRQEWAKTRAKKGDLFWSVNNSLIWFIEYPPIQGRREFWNDYAIGVDGRLLYSVIRWSKNVYEKNWSGGGNYLGCTIYPSPTGLAKSIRWETIRDGLDDYDYLHMLDRRLKRYRTSDRSDAESAARRAERLVDQASLTDGLDSPQALMKRRSVMARLIVALAPQDD